MQIIHGAANGGGPDKPDCPVLESSHTSSEVKHG